jgi:hypothetical protein
MARWTLGFLIGVVWITHFSHLPTVKLAYLLILFSIILITFAFFKRLFLQIGFYFLLLVV